LICRKGDLACWCDDVVHCSSLVGW
jgi:hypothetical protein